jgi:hypothetical protein
MFLIPFESNISIYFNTHISLVHVVGNWRGHKYQLLSITVFESRLVHSVLLDKHYPYW